MRLITTNKSTIIWILAAVAVIFGVLTIKSGGQVLFGDISYQKAAGNYVLFVVWFNFLAGFVYLAAGAGIWMCRHWAVWLSIFIATATIIVFAAFGVHILGDGEYAPRTYAAMSLRSLAWIAISIFSYRGIISRNVS